MEPSINANEPERVQSVWPSSATAARSDSPGDIVAELNQLIDGFRSLISQAETALSGVLGTPGDGAKLVAPQPVQRYVTQNPWRAVAIAAAVGAVLAYLMPSASGPNRPKRGPP